MSAADDALADWGLAPERIGALQDAGAIASRRGAIA